MSELLNEIPRKSKIELEKYGAKVILEFFGGTGDVEKGVSLTGSATKLTIIFPDGRKSVGLIDFGMFQGCENAIEYNEILPFNLVDIDFVIVSHTHIDHIGKLLYFSKDEFKGTIWTIKINKEILFTMLSNVIKFQPKNKTDNIKILENKIKNHLSIVKNLQQYGNEVVEDIYLIIDDLKQKLYKLKEKNKDKTKKDFFNTEDLLKLLNKVNSIGYNEKFKVKNDVEVSFINAGHLPGSAQSILKVKVGNNKYIKLGFSGDIGKIKNPSKWGPPVVSKTKLDLFMIESTYAGKKHLDFQKEENGLIDSINKTIKKGSKIIIPNFMQGRSQEMIMYLQKLMNEGKIDTIPIFVHSANINKISEIYSRNFPKIFGNNLSSKKVKPAITGKGKNRQDNFLKYKGPAVLIVSGGMYNGGTVMDRLHLLENNKYLFVSTGYQSNGTLGNNIFIKLVKFIEIPIVGKININADLHDFKGLSGHADEEDLLYLLSQMSFSKDAKIVINHGEKGISQTLFGLAIKGVVGRTKEILFADFNEKSYIVNN